MGTRGLQVVRFHKRYYIFYNQWDSYPDGLGRQIAAEVPADASKYQEWLADQRKTAAEWEAIYEVFISIELGSDKTTNIPDFMRQQFPSLLAPLNDTFIKWIYTVDLDREVFSVNNSAHFKLHQIPHIDWISSLASGELCDQISIPGAVPADTMTNLVIKIIPQDSELLRALSGLTFGNTIAPAYEVVTPKNLKDIPWRQRHGPTLRMLIFYLWSKDKEDSLAASLLQMHPEDLPFREIAFAVVCLAAGGKNINVVSGENVASNGIFGFINKDWQSRANSDDYEYDADSEFISVLASGAHLDGSAPGTSPESTTYWFGNVLVVLVARLYRPGAAEEGIRRIVRFWKESHSTKNVDALLISIEHVVLVHASPGGKVQHTAVMPLIEIENHLTMSVEDRYTKSYLKELAAKGEEFVKKQAKKQRKAYQQRSLRNEGMDISYGDDDDDEEGSEEEEESVLRVTQVEGSVYSTFYALVHLFEAAACKHMPPAKVAEGLLPNEIYTQIIKHVDDMETRESLMKVSRVFRRICHETLLLADDFMFEPAEACLNVEDPGRAPEYFDLYDTETGSLEHVQYARAGGFLDGGGPKYKVLIGTERNKRSLLTEAQFKFVEVNVKE